MKTTLEHSVALAGSAGLYRSLGAFGEVAGVFNDDIHQNSVFTTLGLAFGVSSSLVFDVAFVAGLSEDAPDFQLLVGFTANLGRISGRSAGD